MKTKWVWASALLLALLFPLVPSTAFLNGAERVVVYNSDGSVQEFGPHQPPYTPYPTYTLYPTYTPRIPEPTLETIITPQPTASLQKCEIRADSGVKYYAQPNASSGALGYLETGITYQPKTILEANGDLWAHISGKGYAANSINFLIFDNEACRDLLLPVATIAPTIPGPTPTPIGRVHVCLKEGSYINVRTGPATTYDPPVGKLYAGQRLELVTKFQSQWWEVKWNDQPGYYLAGWLAKEC